MRADRLISFMMLLQSRGRLTVADLAARLEVSERTVYRDLDALSIAGVPVITTPGPGGGVELMPGYRSSLSGLSVAEVQTLLVAASSPLSDLGRGTTLDQALLKLLAAVPNAQVNEAERLRALVHLDPSRWSAHGRDAMDWLSVIQDAVWESRLLDMTYRDGRGAVSERLIAPLGLVAKGDVWYVVALRQGGDGDGAMRTYRVGRVLAARPRDERFERPAGFDLAATWRDAQSQTHERWRQYPVIAWFAPEALPNLWVLLGEDTAGRETFGVTRPDGWVEVELHFASLDQARWQLLAFGRQAVVVTPVELRDAILTEARAVVARSTE